MHKQNDECNTTKKTNADSYVQQQRTKKVQILVFSGHIFELRTMNIAVGTFLSLGSDAELFMSQT